MERANILQRALCSIYDSSLLLSCKWATNLRATKQLAHNPTSLSFSGSEKNLEAARKQGDSGSPLFCEPETAVALRSAPFACHRFGFQLAPSEVEL